MSSQPWFTGSTRLSSSSSSFYLPPHLRTTTQPPQVVQQPPPSSHDHISNKFDELDLTDDDDHQLPAVGGKRKNDSTTTTPPLVEATGVDIPPPATSFEAMGFKATTPHLLYDNITRRCKYVDPTPIQSHAIPVAMAGRDLMACAHTGSGKTAAFCFPIIHQILLIKHQQRRSGRTACPLALIMAPTRELASQIHEEANKFSYRTGLKVVVAYGGAPILQQLRNLEKGVDILVATPGRLVDMIERSKVSLRNVKYLVLDEADRMLDMGFECQVRKIVQQMEMPPPGSRQTMLFSATFPHEIKKLASDFLSNYIFLAAGKVGSSTNLIVQKVEFVADIDKRDRLVNLLRSHKTDKTTFKDALTLVFVETKRGADALERWLSRKGFPSTAIHGDKVQMERERALRSFRSGLTPVLVATDVAARGLDIPHVAHVINFDLPRAVDDYVHRIGRTGRAGKSGLATAFFSQKNVPLAKGLLELMQESNQEIPTFLTEYAANPPYSSGSSGISQSSRYGRPTKSFGGHHEDYRATSGGEYVGDYGYNYGAGIYGSNTYNDFNYDYAPAAAAADSFSPGGSYNYGYNDTSIDYGSVTATGWD